MKRLVIAICVIATLPAAAHAAIVINVDQVGTSVVASGSGTFNTAGLTNRINDSGLAGIYPNLAFIRIGSSSFEQFRGLSGPTSFSSNFTFVVPTSTSGDVIGVNGTVNVIYLTAGYQSGTQLSGSATFANSTFGSLGLNVGTYVFQSAYDSLTVNVGQNVAAAVPEPATWAIMVSGFGLIGGAMRRRSTRVRFARPA